VAPACPPMPPSRPAGPGASGPPVSESAAPAADAKVFLSYSRKDGPAVRRLAAALESQRVGAWVDWEDIPPSAQWWREICTAIESVDAFVCVMSPDALASKVCGDELAHAQRHHKRLIPVVCRDVESAPKIDEELRRIHWIHMRPEDDFDAAVAKVVEAVATDLEWVHAHTRLVERSIEWDASGRDDSFLLQKNDLAEAERWLAIGPDKEPRPTALQSEYIIAGRSAATRRQRRLTVYAVLAGVLIAAGAVAALLGFRQAERNASESLSRQLAAESTLALGVDPGAALARALLAWRTRQTHEARSALFGAVYPVAGATRLLRGHEGAVAQTVFSPDGRLLATAGKDAHLMLWDVATGQPVRQLAGHAAQVSKVAFSPDGRRLASASADKTAIVWDAATGARLHRLAGHDDVVVNLAFSPDGSRIATAGADDSVALWDAGTGALVHRLKPASAFALAFSPDGRQLATGGSDATASLWDTRTGVLLHRLAGHPEGFLPLVTVAFIDGGRRLVTASSEGKEAIVWDVDSGHRAAGLGLPDAAIQHVVASPDGRRIATGTNGGDLVVWEAQTGRQIARVAGHLTTELIYNTTAFSADGRRLVGRPAANTIVLWDIDSGREVRRVQAHGKEILNAAVGPDGRWLVTGGVDATAMLWDLLATQLVHPIAGPAKGVARGGFSRDGRWLAVSRDDNVSVFDAGSGAQLRDLASGSFVTAFAFSPDSSRLATGGRDGATAIWEVASGAPIQRIGPLPDAVAGIEFSADGKRLTTRPDRGESSVWQLDAPSAAARIEPGETAPRARWSPPGPGANDGVHILSTAHSPDGTRFAVGDVDGATILRDAASGAVLHRLFGHPEGVQSVAFSQDGRFLATGGRDDVALLWDVKSGRLLHRLARHRGTVGGLAFSPDGRLLATASEDRTAILWDTATGRGLHRFDGLGNSIFERVSFSPDGRRLLTSAEGGGLLLWDLDSASLAEQACRLLDPGVDEADWKRIGPDRPFPVSCRDLGRLLRPGR
jgi:WD40 repeat protein